MARYRTIVPSLWDDAWFSEQSARVKLAWFYLLTNTFTTPSGIYQLNQKIAQVYLGFDEAAWVRVFEKIAKDGKAVVEDEWILIPNYIRHQPSPAPTVWRLILKQVAEAPEKLQKVWHEHNDDRLPIAYRYPIDSPSGISLETE